MPRYKPSLGEIEITTPHPEFRNYILEELRNLQAWNPQYIINIGDTYWFNRESKDVFLWKIRVTRTGVKVISKNPVVYLRQGLRILMGSGKLEMV